MPKITFYEYRPGHWVKQVDGETVGPATAEEVATWKREKAAPAHIWDDVVAAVPRPKAGDVMADKPSAAQTGAPAERTESDQSTIWEDLVKRTRPAVQAEGPPRPHPRQEDVGQAEQAEIWQDVVKRVLKPGPKPERQPARETPSPPKPAPAAKPGPATEAPPARKSISAKPAPPAIRTPGESTIAKKAFAAEVLSPKLAQGSKPAAKSRTEEKAAPGKKMPEARPTRKPAAPARRVAKTDTHPVKAPAPPVKPSPALRELAAKATGQRQATERVARAKGTARVVPAKKTAPTKRHKPVVKDTLPARLLDEIDEEKSAPASASSEGATSQKPSTGARPRSSPVAASHHTARKTKATAAPERPNQLYLWIAAGQTDDLIATVRTGLARYQERFSQAAEVVLCHSIDLPALEAAKLPVDLREGKSLAPRNFWIGLK